MAELWGGLARSLSLLDRLAADPESLTTDDASARLQRLQYSLHVASEEAYGLDPPADAGPAHDELAWALGGARDARGPGGVGPLLPGWRVPLFRVRLARLRLATPKASPEPAAVPEPQAA